MSTPLDIPVPFAEARAVVRPEWIDYNGHMNVGYFSVVFDVAADAFLEFLGFTQEFRRQNRSTTFALEQHLNYLREVNEGDTLRFEARLLDFGDKRFHFYQEMFRVGEDRLKGLGAAELRQLLVNDDLYSIYIHRMSLDNFRLLLDRS